jgi:hypothetical protein
MNSNGLGQYIVEKCYTQAKQARKLHIQLRPFMIANGPYCSSSFNKFTDCRKKHFAGLKGLGEMISKT